MALKRYVLFLLALLLIAWSYNFSDILHQRPRSVHQWRQADCLSLTDNYYHGNGNPFTPELNLLFSDNETTGKSAGEFPLLYYFIAILWKIFGKHESIFRLVTMAFSFLGLFTLFRLSFAILKDYFWAFFSAVLLFTSPIYAFYGSNFLINVPAFAMMLVAVWYFYKFWTKGENKHFLISMLFFLVAGLFKTSALLSFFVVGAIYLADSFRLVRFKPEGRLFERPILQGIPFVGVLMGVASWYIYAEHYNGIHGGRYTFNSTQSYWETSPAAVKAAFVSVKNFIIFQVYSIPSFIYFIVSFLFLAWNFKRVSAAWRLAIPFLIIGYGVFLLLFFYSLNSHDYYHIDFLIIPVVINLAFLHYLSKNEVGMYQSKVTKLFFGVFLIYNVLYCSNNLHLRYWSYDDKDYYYRQMLSPKIDIDLWAYDNWAYQNGPYETVTPVLRSMGIKREDAVICPEDISFSITLYLMDQRGWTNYSQTLSDSAVMADRIRHGAKYMMLVDTASKRLPYIKPYIGHELRTYQKLHIYDLRPYAQAVALKPAKPE